MLHSDDRWAISETLALHGQLFDSGELDRLLELFTSDVVYDMSATGVGTFTGIEMVRAAAQRMAQAPVGPFAHHVTNVVVVRDDGDEVTTDSKVLMLMKQGGMESALQRDVLRRTGTGWRISHRVITPQRAALPDAEHAHAVGH